MKLKMLIFVLAFVLAMGCAASDKSKPAATLMDELSMVGECMTRVLKKWPDFPMNNQELAKKILEIRKTGNDSDGCKKIIVSDGVIRLSNGAPVIITRMKTDFRCPCLSIWVPQFFLRAGGSDREILVNHPDTPKNCEEVCQGRKIRKK